MVHAIKINRTNKLAPKLPTAKAEIWDSIPQGLIDTLTSNELAMVVNALDKHWHKAVRHAQKEVVADGYVWSDKHQALLDVVYPKQQGACAPC